MNRRAGAEGGTLKRDGPVATLVPLTAADVRALDLNAAHLGVPTTTLMANAGAAVAATVQERYPHGVIGVFVGGGNNGGDGLVAATRLRQAGREIHVLLSGTPDTIRGTDARQAYEEAMTAGVPIQSFSDPNLEDVVESIDLAIDALLGVGASGPLRPPLDRIVTALSQTEVPIVAVDLPTGHGTDAVLPAVCTVTFHDEKVDMDHDACGDIIVAPIGIPEAAATETGPGDLIARYPRSMRGGHKGQHGRLLVVAGGPFTGAPILSCLGALSTGLDLVFAAVPTPVVAPLRNQIPEVIVEELEGDRLGPAHIDAVVGMMAKADVLLIGPGIGEAAGSLDACRALFDAAVERGLGVVVDADPLQALGDAGGRKGRIVLTPHRGEFHELSGTDLRGADVEARVAAIRAWRRDGGPVVLLKGAEDVIVGDGPVVLNKTHHETMTAGGTGDVLAGCVAALLARGASPFDAARVGAWLSGSAGLYAFEDHGYGVKASDVAIRIADVLGDHFGHPAI